MSSIRPTRADSEPNDRFGYSYYVIAIPASKSLTEVQQAVFSSIIGNMVGPAGFEPATNRL